MEGQLQIPVQADDLESVPEKFHSFYQRLGRQFQIRPNLTDNEKLYIRQYIPGPRRSLMTVAEKLERISALGAQGYLDLPY